MTPWVQRGGNGPRTHALIVGVSEYAHLPRGDEAPPVDRETLGLRQLESAAAGAAAFAAWIRDEYANPDAPLGSVWLLLSPSNRETEQTAALGGAQPARATAAATRQALSEWVQACSDPQHVAIAYLAGHGIMLSKDEGAVVLLEDFAADSARSSRQRLRRECRAEWLRAARDGPASAVARRRLCGAPDRHRTD